MDTCIFAQNVQKIHIFHTCLHNVYISKYTCCMNYTDYIMQYENLGTTASVQTWRQKRRQKLMGNWFLWHTVGRTTHVFYLLDSSSLTSPPPLLSFKQFPKVFLVNIIFLKLTYLYSRTLPTPPLFVMFGIIRLRELLPANNVSFLSCFCWQCCLLKIWNIS